MLTAAALKNLKPKSKPYKSTDRDGLYAYISPGGAISFRYDYRFNGRRETLTLGRYGRGGLSLAQARAAVRDQADDRQRRVAGSGEAAGEASPTGGAQLRTCGAALDGHRPDG
nr:Arm DNA-binding domain-containing protein [Brevundimonas sp. Leaf168]